MNTPTLTVFLKSSINMISLIQRNQEGALHTKNRRQALDEAPVSDGWASDWGV